MIPLTKSQRKVFDFVNSFIEKKGYSPTFRDIQSHFGFASLGSVHTYIKMLKKKGFLVDQKRTSIALNDSTLSPNPHLTIPFIGTLSAGFPIETFSQTQSIIVPLDLVPHPDETYALRVKGDTLLDEHILDGDLLLIEARNVAQEGELVVARLNQNNTIVKRFYPEGSYIRLEGSEDRHEPIILNPDELQIQGVIVHLIRNYL